jgi:hypothetical protein
VWGQEAHNDCLHPRVTFAAIDKSDRKIEKIKTDLRAAELKVEVAGHRAKLLELTFIHPLNRVVLVLDKSASMGPGDDVVNKWPWVESAAAEFASRFPAGHAAGMVLFSDDIERRVSLDEPRTALMREARDLTSLKPSGHTRLWDALDGALAMFGTPQVGDAIILASDGGDNRSSISLSKIKQKLVDSGVRVFVVLLPAMHPTTAEESSGLVDLVELAHETGGYPLTIKKPQSDERGEVAVDRGVDFMMGQSTQFYLAELEISPPPPTGRTHIRLEVAGPAAKHRSLDLLYPSTLPFCTASSPPSH